MFNCLRPHTRHVVIAVKFIFTAPLKDRFVSSEVFNVIVREIVAHSYISLLRNLFESFFHSNDELELLEGIVENKKFTFPKFVVGSVWTDKLIELFTEILFNLLSLLFVGDIFSDSLLTADGFDYAAFLCFIFTFSACIEVEVKNSPIVVRVLLSIII